jgi:hypothetical protein
VADTLTQEDISTLDRFRAKAQEFIAAFNRLVSLGPDVPDNMRAEYQSVLSSASAVKTTVEYITKTVDSVTGFFSNIFGLNGVPMVQRSINQPTQLGVLPLIPIALVIGAITALGAVLSKIYLFERKLAEQKRLEAGGLSPADAAALASQNSGLSANIAKIVKPLPWLFGLYIAYQFLNRRSAG